MDDQLNLIITGDRGKIFRMPFSKKKFRIAGALSGALLVTLTGASLFTLSLYRENAIISERLSEVQEQLITSAQLIQEQKRDSEEERLALNLKVANLELNNVRQAAAFKEEKESLLSTAVSELNERSELIEKIVDSIGVELPDNSGSKKNSGGPFIKGEADTSRDTLLYRADRYLKTISHLPLGRPVDGEITSRFGKREDPVNGKRAFHTGIDFQARKGDKIYATADGVVRQAHYNGGYGNYVLVDHGNGYTTAFAHMQAYLVKKGDHIRRGQLVGLVGNTGRSTGAHLHYEVCLDKKPINPYPFMTIADLNKRFTSTAE